MQLFQCEIAQNNLNQSRMLQGKLQVSRSCWKHFIDKDKKMFQGKWCMLVLCHTGMTTSWFNSVWQCTDSQEMLGERGGDLMMRSYKCVISTLTIPECRLLNFLTIMRVKKYSSIKWWSWTYCFCFNVHFVYHVSLHLMQKQETPLVSVSYFLAQWSTSWLCFE